MKYIIIIIYEVPTWGGHKTADKPTAVVQVLEGLVKSI